MSEEGRDAKDRSYTFKVNGIEFVSEIQKVVTREILELAKQRGAIPGNPDEYILQGEKGEYRLDDVVDLSEDNIFITIRDAPTQVARPNV